MCLRVLIQEESSRRRSSSTPWFAAAHKCYHLKHHGATFSRRYGAFGCGGTDDGLAIGRQNGGEQLTLLRRSEIRPVAC